MKKKVAFIIPACNEQKNIPLLLNEIHEVMEVTPYEYSITFVDDGSTDNSLEVIKALAIQYANIFFISLSRNFGHQNALKAGLDNADGDCTIMMDADLQHPPKIITQLLQQWEAGYDVVYTIRKDHIELPLVKRRTSNLFYQIINNLSDIELEQGTADFRLMDKKVVAAFKGMRETELFIRGLIKWMGFSQIGIEYDPGIRKEGVSKYTLKTMIRFALQGITSFSTKPLYGTAYLGFVFSIASLFYFAYIIYSYYAGHTISGWASIIATITFFGGLQLMILGIIGLYLGKLFMQSKHRPHYIIKETNLPE
ncbi:MAG: glycosyltransferase family 2 protein [Sediminibacterium sp.]|nr:MAG: dolichol-phosphate [Chitinophagaceae bacterium]MDP1843182.1 glycosyltransferase family 2 protein [Sediminibacterium sp.]